MQFKTALSAVNSKHGIFKMSDHGDLLKMASVSFVCRLSLLRGRHVFARFLYWCLSLRVNKHVNKGAHNGLSVFPAAVGSGKTKSSGKLACLFW